MQNKFSQYFHFLFRSYADETKSDNADAFIFMCIDLLFSRYSHGTSESFFILWG